MKFREYIIIGTTLSLVVAIALLTINMVELSHQVNLFQNAVGN